MRRTHVVLLLAALVVAPALAACGSGPSDSKVAPKRLACRDLDGADLKDHTNDTAPVPCAKRHTAQTFFVGRFPARLGDDYNTKKQGAYVFDTQGRVRLFTRYGTGPKALAEDVKQLLAQG